MKKLTNAALTIVVSSIFALAPVMSNAQVKTDLTADVTGTMGITNNGYMHMDDSNMNSTSSANVGLEINLDSNKKDDVQTGTEMTNMDSNSSLEVNSDGVAVVSSSQVNSEADLAVFNSNIKATKHEVSEVETNSKENGEAEVKVIYKHHGKFLGFIPVTVRSTTTVDAKADADTEVRSHMAWWGFLVNGANYQKDNIESSIKNNSTVQANATVNASAQAKAKVAEAIVTELATHSNTGASMNY